MQISHRWRSLTPMMKPFTRPPCEDTCLLILSNSFHLMILNLIHTCWRAKYSWSFPDSFSTSCVKTIFSLMLEPNKNANSSSSRSRCASRTILTRYPSTSPTRKSNSCNMLIRWDTIYSSAKISWSRRVFGSVIWISWSKMSTTLTTKTSSDSKLSWLTSSPIVQVWWLLPKDKCFNPAYSINKSLIHTEISDFHSRNT